MARLTAAARERMPARAFAGRDRSFPVNDERHARLAISGATRAEHAGTISPAEAARIKAWARKRLKKKRGGRAEGAKPRQRADKPRRAGAPVSRASRPSVEGQPSLHHRGRVPMEPDGG